ncbi:MAG: hypothetical protein Q8M58_13320, partial [Anaerolineales bacterium]|nr:hypothetical protein [Anaerolineales bacterium]
VYQGQGKFSSNTQAGGTANFIFSCRSNDGSYLWCMGGSAGASSSSDFTGTVPWSFSLSL